MDKIDFLPNTSCSPSKKLIEGCAAGVSYMVVICDSDCGQTTSLSYLNMSTGLVETTPPADFILGSCAGKTFKVGCKPFLETESFFPSVGQVDFTLTNSPAGDVRFSRNGSTLADGATLVSGSVVTYVPSENNGETLLDTDRVDITYVYSICDSAVVPFVDCAGNEILDGATLLTCDSLDSSTFTVDPVTGQISLSGGSGGTGGGSVVSVSDTITGNQIGVITIDDVPTILNETVTSIGTITYDSITGLLTIPYTDETGTVNTKTVTVLPTFVVTDDQELTGDTTGTVNVTLTAVEVDNQINYTLKADLNVATETPLGGENQLKFDESLGGFYVEPVTSITGAVGERWSYHGPAVPPGNTTEINLVIDGLFDLKVMEGGTTKMWFRPISTPMDIVAQWEGLKAATRTFGNYIAQTPVGEWKEFQTTWDAVGMPQGEAVYMYDKTSDKAYEIRYELTNANGIFPQTVLITVERVR